MKAIERTILLALLALGVVPGLGADSTPAPRQEFRQSYALSPHGRVAIENLYGDVRIVGWDRDEVCIEAIKSAADASRLEAARIVVDATAESVSVRTQYAGGQPEEPASVAYSISVPRSANLDNVRLVNGALSIIGLAGSVKAASINGNIKAEKLEGEADLATVNGQVEADFERIRASQPISLRSVNGPIVLTIPSGSGAQLVAQNRSGGIETDLGRAAPQQEGHRYEAVLGGGGAPILLRNVNGGISIHATWSRRRERTDL